MRAKASNRSEPDIWSNWQTLSQGPGRFETALGRERFNGSDVSLYGVYRFQLRVKAPPVPVASDGTSGGGAAANTVQPAAGLSALQLVAYFENGIMSIPQIFDGRNTIHFRLKDASKLDGPLAVTWRYQTPAGEREHHKVLNASDFQANEAAYVLDAPDLIRCNALQVAY